MRRTLILVLFIGVALLPTLVHAQNGVQTTPGAVKNNPLFPSGNPFNPVVPNNNNGGMSMQDIMQLRMMQQMMNGRRNPPKYGAAGMRQPQFYGQYQNPVMAPFAAPQAPPVDSAKIARDTERAKAKQRADEIRAKDAAARERLKAKLLEEKAAREGLAPARPQPQPSEKAPENAAEEKAAEEEDDAAEKQDAEKPAEKP